MKQSNKTRLYKSIPSLLNHSSPVRMGLNCNSCDFVRQISTVMTDAARLCGQIKERQTDRQTDRQTETQRETNRERDRDKQTERERETDRQTDRQRERDRERQRERQRQRQTETERHRH